MTPTLPARYDWFSVTAEYNPSTLLDGYLQHLNGEARTVKPRNGYTHAFGVFIGQDAEVVVEYSPIGAPHVLATGYASQRIYEITRDHFPRYQVARADVAIDFDHDDWFEVIHSQMRSLSHQRGVKHHLRGDWETPGHPDGRTTYAGSLGKSTVVRRLYEFSKCHGYGLPVRYEIELKPKSKHKQRYALMSPIDVIRSDAYSVELLRCLGYSMERIVVHEGEKPPSTAAWFKHLARQYGQKLSEFVAYNLDGDISELGPELIRCYEADRESRQQISLATARLPEPSYLGTIEPAKVANS